MVKGVKAPITHYRVVGELATPTRIVRAPLIGRERELVWLEKSWGRAQVGSLTAPAAMFRGEAGIGKSRLALAASEMVQRDGAVVLELFGSPLHAGVGLHPVRTLLERRCVIGQLTDPAEPLGLLRAELVALGLDPETAVPLLAPVLGIGPQEGYQPVAAEGRKLQQLISEAVCRYLLACLGGGPGLVVAEDMQCFDASTIEVLGSLLATGGGRVLIALTGRDGGLPPGWPVKVFDLAPLTAEQSNELVMALDPTLTEQQRIQICERGDGVPFYLEQVVAELQLAPADQGNGTAVPERLYEPLLARLRASPAAVRVAEAAAVIGRRGGRSLLAAVADLDTDRLNRVIDELRGTRVFEPHGTDDWGFRHELLREVAAELTPPSVRRELHAKVADALVEGLAGDPDWRLVAAHYEHAERHADSASAYQSASADARRRGALAEARSYLSRALTEIERCPPGPDRDRREIAPRLERGYLTATAEGNQSPIATADFERCLQLIGTDLFDDQVLATLFAVGAHYVWAADLQRATQILELLQAHREQKLQWLGPAIDCGSGMVAYLRGEFDTARAYFDLATVGMVEDDHNPVEAWWFVPHDPVALAHGHLAFVRVLCGDLAGAEAELIRAVRRAEQLGFPQGPYNNVYTVDMESVICCEAGQLDRARACVADMIEQSERHGFDFWQLFGAMEHCSVDAQILLASDDPDPTALSDQIATVTQTLDMWRGLGVNAYRSEYDCLLARLLIVAGQPEMARARIDGELQFGQDTGQRFYEAELLRVRAHTQTDPNARAAGFAAARDVARRQGAPLFELRAALDDFELRGQPAREALSDAAGRLVRDSPLPELARAREILGE
jgi:hypothetical protein